MSDADDAMKLRLKLKLPRSMSTSSVSEAQKKLLIGARGGAAVKELLSTAPNIEVAIRDFQAAHGVAEANTKLFVRRTESKKKEKPTTFTPAVELLDLLQVRRSSIYQSLLDQMKREMLLRIADLPQSELPRVLEQTFPYIEFRELRAIPIAVLARQEETPELYLRELTENRRILAELPVHVRRKILQVDRGELQLLVEECTREYVSDQLEWYLNHPTSTAGVNRTLTRRNSNKSIRTGSNNRKRSLDESAGGSLWNVSSHVPSAADAAGSSSSASGFSSEHRPSYSQEERRRNNPALLKLVEMLGDSESLYLSTLEIWRNYVVAANIPGSATNNHPKEYVDYVPLLGAMRSDLANLQRDKTTALLRSDPLHKFIWFLDRALKNQTLEIAQLHELLGFIGRLRTADLPANKKFRKKSGVEEEEESFEVVLGPPPVEELLGVLDKIAKIDARLIFAEPVPDDVPKYREIIKDPMDLSTMRKKAKRGKYKTLDAFIADFNLMIRNCMTFNPDTTIFYKEGKRIGKRGNELIERNAAVLRGEPQRIRTKKRRKTGGGPTSEALSMLTSTGVVSIKDFGDVDQSGMIPEGLCDDLLADVALILSDPLVKQLICEALMKNLVVCWQRMELPTDNLICRALVQLLQIGNPSSVRRMIRKQDYVLRSPQVVTMRVVLPLLLRSMVGFRVYYTFPQSLQCDSKAKEDVLGPVLWDNVLRASSAIRAMTKSFAVQCLVDHQIDAGAQLLQHLLGSEDEVLLRDRVLLHAVAEVVLEQVKAAVTSTSVNASTSDASSNGAENGEVTMTLGEQMQALPIWKPIVDQFFVDVLAKRIQGTKESMGSVVSFADNELVASEEENEAPGETKSKKRKRQLTVTSFPVPVFQEKVSMVLASLLGLVEKGNSASMTAIYLKQTLGVLRTNCSTLEEFEALWESDAFAGCRQFYEPMLSKCPTEQSELFSAMSSDSSVKTEATSSNVKAEHVETKVKGEHSAIKNAETEPRVKTEGGANPEGIDANLRSEAEGAGANVDDIDTSSKSDSSLKSEAVTKPEQNDTTQMVDVPVTDVTQEGKNSNVATENGDGTAKADSTFTDKNSRTAASDENADADTVATEIDGGIDTDVTMADVEAQSNKMGSKDSAKTIEADSLTDATDESTPVSSTIDSSNILAAETTPEEIGIVPNGESAASSTDDKRTQIDEPSVSKQNVAESPVNKQEEESMKKVELVEPNEGGEP